MIEKIVHVLCEGQTEQGFVDDVLKPYLILKGITSVKSILVTINKKKNVRGGLVSYQHALDDLSIMIKSNIDGEYERHIFTTMFDLYALPNDFQVMRNHTLLLTGIPGSNHLNEHFTTPLALIDSCRIYNCMSMRHWFFVG